MESFFLNEIPAHLLLATFRKIPTKPLCRLRRTCSSMNEFIEENSSLFARRNGPLLGISTSFEVGTKGIKLGSHRERVHSDFERHLSAISFDKLSISFFTGGAPFFDEFVELLRNQEISCDRLCIYCKYLTAEKAMEILNTVNCREEIRITGDMHDPMEFLILVNEFEHRSQIELSIHTDGYAFPQHGLFEFIKDIRTFECKSRGAFSPETVHRLLWDLHRCKERINLRNIILRLNLRPEDESNGFPYVRLEIPRPPLTNHVNRKATSSRQLFGLIDAPIRVWTMELSTTDVGHNDFLADPKAVINEYKEDNDGHRIDITFGSGPGFRSVVAGFTDFTEMIKELKWRK